MPNTEANDGAVVKPTKGELTRGRLLDAAVEVFGVNGFQSTSVADVARRVGITPAAAFAHFGSKDLLFNAAVDHDALQFINESLAAVPEGVESPFRFEYVINAMLDGMDQHPLVHRVLSGREPSGLIRIVDNPVLAETIERSIHGITVGQADGLIRSDIVPLDAATGMTYLLLAILLAHVQMGVFGDPHIRQSTIGVVAHALDTGS